MLGGGLSAVSRALAHYQKGKKKGGGGGGGSLAGG